MRQLEQKIYHVSRSFETESVEIGGKGKIHPLQIWADWAAKSNPSKYPFITFCPLPPIFQLFRRPCWDFDKKIRLLKLKTSLELWKWTLQFVQVYTFFYQRQFFTWKSKPSLKIRTTSAIFWDYLGMFRDYGQNNIYFRNKTFLFLKIERWNFQHLFENEFRETWQSFSSFWHLLFTLVVWLSWNLVRFHKIHF